MKKILPKYDRSKFASVKKGGIQAQLQETGRLPPVSILLTPLNGDKPILIDRFLNYSFQGSMLIPVDTFSFGFVAPDDERPATQIIKEGDLISLLANGELFATGIVDHVEVECDADFGEKVQIGGRDLMGQLEDQSMVSINSDPIYGDKYTIASVVNSIIKSTRIPGLITQDAPKSAYLFAGEPSESKLTALQRFLEPLNCLAWTAPNGKLIVGRPNMAQKSLGTLILSKSKRQSNVSDMKAIRASAQIPNIMVPIWAGQENTQSRTGKQNALYNAFPGPARLFRLGHQLPRAIVVSTPEGEAPQDFSDINFLRVGSSNLLQAHAKRELARSNHRELIVQVAVKGHYNDNGEPYKPDTIYKIEFDRGEVDEAMYLFQVDYSLQEDAGQQTLLYFCRLGTIVSDVRAP